MSRRFFVQVFAVVALLVGGAFAFSACGESEEEQASAKVCDARDDIGQQVDRLSNLILATATVDDVRTGLQAIGEFAEQVSAVVDDLGRSLSLSGAQSQLKAALADL